MRRPRFFWILELIGGPYDGQLVTVGPSDLALKYNTTEGIHVYVRNTWSIGDGCPYMEYRGFEPEVPR